MFARPEPQLGTQRDVIPQRAAALLIDSALVTVLVGVAALLVGTGPLLILVGAAISFGYLVFFEGTYGQTVGKHLMNLVVVSRRGYPCSYRAAALRTVLRVVDALPSFFIVGLASIFLTRRSQRLGDIAADTIVVRSMARGARMF